MGTINEKGEILPQATGFLVNINDIFHLVTAKHVVFDRQKDVLNDSNILTFYNTKDGKIQARSIQDMRDNINCNWIFHENREVDIGIIPFGIVPTDDVLFIPDNLFLTADQLLEIYEVFFLSYQPGIRIQQKISPIIRSGTK